MAKPWRYRIVYWSLPNNRYCCLIGRLFSPIVSTIGLSDYHTIILTLNGIISFRLKLIFTRLISRWCPKRLPLSNNANFLIHKVETNYLSISFPTQKNSGISKLMPHFKMVPKVATEFGNNVISSSIQHLNILGLH